MPGQQLISLITSYGHIVSDQRTADERVQGFQFIQSIYEYRYTFCELIDAVFLGLGYTSFFSSCGSCVGRYERCSTNLSGSKYIILSLRSTHDSTSVNALRTHHHP